ncbi:MAG: saccharopine dehydrogenase C-terminal domain-containing protein [candidate division WOR-3 bacterium]
MKKVLILGAGLVARPMVRYLLEIPDFAVTVASRTVSKAQELVGANPRGQALALLADDDSSLGALVRTHDLVVSLLPYTLHLAVAKHCLAWKKPLVTTSYVSDAMRALDADAKRAGIIFLNEIGLDPGIDHMSAMQIIERIKAEGCRVTSFMSYCGGLPAPEANDNPLGYKFSWSPKGVVMAGRNDGRYLKDGKEVFVPGPQLFSHRWTLDVPGAGRFEAYPNRNSLPYIALYGLEGVRTMFRGTLRNPGWCETLKAIADLGMLTDTPIPGLAQMTCATWFSRHLAGAQDARRAAAAKLGLDPEHPILDRFAWLGFFDDRPVGIEHGSDLDVLAKLMLDRMAYKPGERDMIVLHHEFETERTDPKKAPETQKTVIHTTLVDYGIPGGDSAMARTVSLPAAVAVKLLLTGVIRLTGVHIPVLRELYEPVLAELSRLGISFQERASQV